MTTLLDEGLLSCAAESYLSGDAEAPLRGTAPFSPIILLVAARTSGVLPSLLDPSAFRGDVRLSGLYRSIRLTLDAYRGDVRRDRGDAEYLAAVRLAEAFRLAQEALRERGGFLDLELDYSFDEQALDDEWRLLAGVLALTLWHVGVAEAREHVRKIVAEGLSGGEGHRFVETALGMQEDTDGLSWRPGQGSLGTLRMAQERGRALLWAAVRGPERSKRPEPVPPEAEPAWATAAKAKAAAEKATKEKLESGPSLLVLASVSHLPGGARDGEGKPGGLTGSTARSEWAPLAGRRLRLVTVSNLSGARATLVAEFPDDVAIIDAILGPLATKAFVALPPLLLLGPPGTGKSRFARRVGEVLGLAVTVYGCAGVSDSSFIGTSRQWSTGRACVPLQAIRRAEAASVLVVLDELSRAGTRRDNGLLTDGVLALTERETARAYQDPFLECAVDLSAVSYIATANTRSGLDAALLSRFRVLEMGARTAASLPALTRGIMADIRAERGLDAAWLPEPDPEEEAVLVEHWRDGSVRTLRQLVETLVAARDALATRM